MVGQHTQESTGTPQENIKFREFLTNLHGELRAGRHVVVHCRMGIGRSSIIAGCLLMKFGYTAHTAVAHISKIRGLRVPDTDEQLAWLQRQEK